MDTGTLKLSPEEQDAAENVMRNQLLEFEAEINTVKEQVHSELAACNGSVYEALRGSYDQEVQTILDRTRGNVEEYIRKMRMANDELAETTETVEGIMRG